jgi:uncharacterized protein (DUF1330 family)
MPKGYVILTETIRDPAGMSAYGKAAGPTLGAHGGTVLVASQDIDVREGEWPATQTVVIAFESLDAARGWYESSEYQAAAALRHEAADSNVVLIAGFVPPA